MSIETAVFAVQRGDQQFSCKGSDLNDKVLAGDLFAVQRGDTANKGTSDQVQDTDLLACTDTDGVTYKVTGAQFKSLFGKPWEGHVGGIWHVNNASETVYLQKGPPYETLLCQAYDANTLADLGMISQINVGEDIVFLTSVDASALFARSTANWDFGKYTDISQVTTLYQTFRVCKSFNGKLGGNWDTSNVTNLNYTFQSAQVFNQDINSWNTSNVEEMVQVFLNAEAFNQPLGNWNTSKVTTMSGMFSSAKAFNQDIGSWDTSNVEDMYNIFASAEAFNQDIGGWDTSNVKELNGAFHYAIAFNQNIGRWNTSNVTGMGYMFEGAEVFNQDIGGWDVSNVLGMGTMFKGAKAFNQDIGGWNTSKVTTMSGMFQGAQVFNQDIGGWDVSNVWGMQDAFENAEAFNQDLSDWCVTNLTTEPLKFDEGATAWTKPRPCWGHCPPKGDPCPFEWKTLPTIQPESYYLKVVKEAKGGKKPYTYTDQWSKYYPLIVESWNPHSTAYKTSYSSSPLQTVQVGDVDYLLGGKNYCSTSTDALTFTMMSDSPGYAADVGNFIDTYSYFLLGDYIYLTTDRGLLYGNKDTQFKNAPITNWEQYNGVTTAYLKSFLFDSSNRPGYYIGCGYLDDDGFKFACMVVIENNVVTNVFGFHDAVPSQGSADFIYKEGDHYVVHCSADAGTNVGWYKFTESEIRSTTNGFNHDFGANHIPGTDGVNDSYAGHFSIAPDNSVGYSLRIFGKADSTSFKIFSNNTIRTVDGLFGDITNPDLGFYVSKDKLYFGPGTDVNSWASSEVFPTPTKAAIVTLKEDRFTVIGDANGWITSPATGYTGEITDGWVDLRDDVGSRMDNTQYRCDCTVRDSNGETLSASAPEYDKTS